MTRPRDFDDVLGQCTSVKCKGNTATADCPCPGHKTPEGHLSLTNQGDRCLAKCHSVHTYQEITAALGFESLTYSSNGHIPKQREVAQYDYTNEDGNLLFQVVRYEPKDFRQRQPNGNNGWTWNLNGVRRVIYRLPEACEAVKAKRTVYVVEGEKDADNGREKLGLICTTAPGGAGKWRPEYNNALTGADVVIIPDNDKPGEEHAEQVYNSLKPCAASVRIVRLPSDVDGSPVKDLSKWIAAGGTREKLEAMVAEKPPRALPFVTARQLAQTEPECPLWIVKGIVADKGITELSSKVKTGKTTLIMAMIADLLNRRSFLGLETQSCPVLYLTEERGATIRAVLARAGISEQDDLHILCRNDVRDMPWREVASMATSYALSVGAGLVVVDTLSRWAALRDDSENSAGAAAEALEPLEATAAAGLGVMVLRHDRKSGGELGDSGRGSSAFSGAADIVLALRRADTPRHDNRRQLLGIGRFEETPSSLTIEFTNGRYLSLGAPLSVERDDAKAKILDVLPVDNAEPMLERAIAERMAHLGRSTVKRALADLQAENRVIRHKKQGKNRQANGYTLAGGVYDLSI